MALKRYRRTWPDEMSALDVELLCFLHGLGPQKGGLGKAQHFKKAAELLWPRGSHHPFVWHPWADLMLESACKHRYLSVSGPGGAGKSEFFAIWAIINWLADPLNTLVMVTSTSLAAARKRIWGSIKDYFLAVPGLPGRLSDTVGVIRTKDKARGIDASDRCGITLIPGDKSQDRASQQKIMGMHNNRVILIGDELPELSPSLVNVAMGNLTTNPFFQFIGIGNPSSYYDPHGQLSTPKDGWGSVTVESESWRTNLGYAIHLDATKSPNIIAGKTLYPFLPTADGFKDAVERLGPDSIELWRMWRGWWCPAGSSQGIYTDPEIEFSGGMEKEVKWSGAVTTVAFLDLGFTNDGDASFAVFGELGTVNGVQTLLMTGSQRLIEEASNPTTRMEQIANKYVQVCREKKVVPRLMGYDGTSAGTMFGEFLSRILGTTETYEVDFCGVASEESVGTRGHKASDLFANRVSELWLCGKDFLHSGQIKGVTPPLARQMIARNMTTIKVGDRMKQQVEQKRFFKKRTGSSPDLADAFFGMLDVCRVRLGFRSQVTETSNRWAAEQWAKFLNKSDTPEQTSVPSNIEEIGLPKPKPKRTGAKQMWGGNQFDHDDGWGSMSLY